MKNKRLKGELKRTIINIAVVGIIGCATIYWIKNHMKNGIEEMSMRNQIQSSEDQ